MGQMFYSLSIAMGILVTFGSYMKKDVSIESSTTNVEIFDTAIAIMAGLMIIPAVFRIFWWRSKYSAGWSGADVHHDPEGLCKYGTWNTDWYSVFCIGALCGTDKLHCPDRKCSIYLPG